MNRIARKMVVLATSAVAIISLVGCATANLRSENEILKQEKWELEQKTAKLENDVIQKNYQCELLINEMQKTTPPEKSTEMTQEVKKIAAKQVAPAKKYEWFAKKLTGKGLEVMSRDDNPTVVITDLFGSGSTELTEAGKKHLKEAGKIIKSEVPAAALRIDGYTDNTPIQKAVKYESNTDLSQARAEAVKKFMEKECRFKEENITARGLGEKNPIADNKTEAGKKKNRRVEIVVILK